MEQTYKRASFSDVVKYSFGGIGSNMAFYLVMSYLTFFYTDIFGLDTMVVSVLMLVSRFIDAFTDPLMGMIGDHTVSKMGRFRPWIIFGAPVLGVLIFMLFTAPDLSPTMKIVYAYVVYIGYSLASTVVNIPYHALTPVMSEDPQQRTTIVTWKQGMGTIPQFVVTVLAIPMVEFFGGGSTGWAIYGAFIAIITTISFWICAWGGKKYDVCDEETIRKAKEKSSFNFGRDMKLLLKNKPMMMLMIAFGTDVLANATCSAVNVYYFKYVIQDMSLVAQVANVTLWTGIVAIPLLPVLTKWLGKRRLFWWGEAISILPLLVLWLVPNPSANLIMMMSLFGFWGFISKFPSFLGWAMLPECSDFAEWKFGQRADGLMSSSLTFVNKFGMAIGGFIASFFLGLVGFVPDVVQPEAVCSMIGFLRFGMPILGYVASLISMWFYEITEDKYKEIRRDLDARYAAAEKTV